LHINTQMFYRIPTQIPRQAGDTGAPQYRLASFPLQQLRRVISTQVHYFDHPLMGMIVQIRRYERPQASDSADNK
jgi:hypothetical protein